MVSTPSEMAQHLQSDCIFCKIIKGEIPSFKIFENDKVFSFLDINPLSAGHTLIVPKYHAASLHEIPQEYLTEIGSALGKVSTALTKTIGMKDYNILQNNGKLAHQAVNQKKTLNFFVSIGKRILFFQKKKVFHVHFHIIPKTSKEDGLGVHWPMSGVEKEALKELSQKIVSNL